MNSDTPSPDGGDRSQGQMPEPEKAPRSGWLRRLIVGIFIVVALVVAYLLAAPSPIDAVAYDSPPPPELTGVLAPNNALAAVEILAPDAFLGAEDVELDEQGRIYGGTLDGRIARLLPDGTAETFAETGGRPLGLDFDADGNLIVADALKGLLSIDPEGNVTLLVAAVEDVPLGFTDDVVVGRDGTIYFSDASTKFGPDDLMYDMLEGRPHGRLIRYDPATQKAEVLLRDLHFANGVALAQDESFVLVNETWRYRITRCWLQGEQAGASDIFVDNLPGFPDGVSADKEGTFWVAIYTVRNPTAEWLAPRPFLRELVAKLPAFAQPAPNRYSMVLAVDQQGKILRSLHDEQGHYWPVTSVEHVDGKLYLGSLLDRGIGRLTLDDAAVEQASAPDEASPDDAPAEKPEAADRSQPDG